jgi:hypothetical protein
MCTCFFVGNTEVSRPLGRREYNIKMGFKEMGWGDAGCVYLPGDVDK